MIESYLIGLATGFFVGIAVIIIPEKLRLIRNDQEYIDISRRRRG